MEMERKLAELVVKGDAEARDGRKEGICGKWITLHTETLMMTIHHEDM